MNRREFLRTSFRGISFASVGIGCINFMNAFPMDNSKSTFDTNDIPIQSNERSLIVISYLTDVDSMEFLYQNISMISISMAKEHLWNYYKNQDGTHNFHVLKNKKATLKNLIDRLRVEGAKPAIKRIDLLLHLHGTPKTLRFRRDDDKGNVINVYKGDIESGIKNLGISEKLRMVYSSACYGAGHIDSFFNAGFKCANGAEMISTNTWSEYPVFLKKWAKGIRFSDCLDEKNHNTSIDSWDNLAFSGMRKRGNKKYKRYQMNSHKKIIGDSNVTINS